MECEQVKKEFTMFDYKSCCESCHQDDEMGFGEDLWFEDPNGTDRNVCCSIYRTWNRKDDRTVI